MEKLIDFPNSCRKISILSPSVQLKFPKQQATLSDDGWRRVCQRTFTSFIQTRVSVSKPVDPPHPRVWRRDALEMRSFTQIVVLLPAVTDSMGCPRRGSPRCYLVFITASSAGSVFCYGGYLPPEEYCELQPLISAGRQMFMKTSDCGGKNLLLC